MWSGRELAARAALRLVQMQVARLAPVSFGLPYQLRKALVSVDRAQRDLQWSRGARDGLHEQAAVPDGLFVRLSIRLV